MADPWFKFYPQDWITGTQFLTAAERGVYISLIAAMYDHGGPVPNEPRRLARITGASNSVFKKTLETLIAERKIIVSDDGSTLINSRAETEIRERGLLRENASKNGRVGGRKAQQNQRAVDESASKNSKHSQKSEGRSQRKKEAKASQKSEAAKPPAPYGDDDPDFPKVWAAWPGKKGSRKVAWEKFRHRVDRDGREAVLAGLRYFLISPEAKRDGGEFVPHLATFLNQDRYLDCTAEWLAAEKARTAVALNGSRTASHRGSYETDPEVGWVR